MERQHNVSIEFEDQPLNLITHMAAMFENLEVPKQTKSNNQWIFRVLQIIHQMNEKAYTPLVVAVDCLHISWI